MIRDDYPTTSIVLIESVNNNRRHGKLLKDVVRDFISRKPPIPFLSNHFFALLLPVASLLSNSWKKQNKI